MNYAHLIRDRLALGMEPSDIARELGCTLSHVLTVRGPARKDDLRHLRATLPQGYGGPLA